MNKTCSLDIGKETKHERSPKTVGCEIRWCRAQIRILFASN